VVLFNGLFSFYHFPFIFDYLMGNGSLKSLYHIILFITSIFMWVPLFPPIPSMDKLSGLQKTAYIFAMGVLLTPACALIIFSKKIIYSTYQHASVILYSSYNPVEDQQLGGVIMKVAQEIIYGTVLGSIFVQWFKKEKIYKIDELPPNNFDIRKE
ncbi:hypothetical protein CGZ90_19260, partial [Fictibacillus aquaticus]